MKILLCYLQWGLDVKSHRPDLFFKPFVKYQNINDAGATLLAIWNFSYCSLAPKLFEEVANAYEEHAVTPF